MQCNFATNLWKNANWGIYHSFLSTFQVNFSVHLFLSLSTFSLIISKVINMKTFAIKIQNAKVVVWKFDLDLAQINNLINISYHVSDISNIIIINYKWYVYMDIYSSAYFIYYIDSISYNLIRKMPLHKLNAKLFIPLIWEILLLLITCKIY